MNVGFVGLGRMGGAMVFRLLAAGHSVCVFNRTAGKTAAVVEAGAVAANSLVEVARFGGVVLTMLADDAALSAVTIELLDALPEGGVHVAMGTHGTAAISSLALSHQERSQSLISAPVLGRPEAVAAGMAAIVAAGSEEAIARCQTLFDALGRRTFAAGSDPVGAATVKIANNFLLGCAVEALAEAYSLIESAGVPATTFHEVVTDGLFASPAYSVYSGLMADKAYDSVGFAARLALKDTNLALAAGASSGVPLPSAEIARDRLQSAVARGDGERDWSVLALEQARAAGLAP